MYRTLAAVMLAATLASGSANAGAILQAVGASSSVGSFPFGGDYDISHTIDQSTLSTPYTSGVTDFDSYVGSTAHLGAGGASEIWYSPEGAITATIVFDLGGSYALDGFALWADWQGVGQGVNEFRLSASSESSFTSSTLLGDFQATDGPGFVIGAASNFGQTFGFAETNASFIQMEIFSNHGATFPVVGFGEAAFRLADTVPGPASLPLLFAGFLGVIGLSRRPATF